MCWTVYDSGRPEGGNQRRQTRQRLANESRYKKGRANGAPISSAPSTITYIMRTFIQFLLVLPAVFAAPTVEPKTIPGSYIFTVRKGSALKTVVEGVSGFFKIKPTRTYSFGEFQAFTMYGVPSTTGLLARFAGIESIEPNAIVYASKLVTQKDATWGLGRISHGAKGFTEYVYNDTAIVDTYAYVIDTVSTSSLVLT